MSDKKAAADLRLVALQLRKEAALRKQEKDIKIAKLLHGASALHRLRSKCK